MRGGLQRQEDSTREEGDREAQDAGEGSEEHPNQAHHYQLGGLDSMEGDREAHDAGEGSEEHLNQAHHYQLGGLGSMVGSPSLGVADSRMEDSNRRRATDTLALLIQRLHPPLMVQQPQVPLMLALPLMLRQLHSRCEVFCWRRYG